MTRDDVLRAALARRRPAHPVPAYAAPYAARVAALEALLPELTDEAWSAPVIHGWMAHEVIAHLMASDRLLAAALGASLPGGPPSSDDPEAYTDEVLAAGLGRDEVLARWRAQAAALCELLSAAEPGLADEKIVASGLRLRARDHLTNRAFETWVHCTDICNVTGILLPEPVFDHVYAMADMGCRSLPLSHRAGGGSVTGVAELVLTGPGGGTWLIRLGEDAGGPESTIVMDVIEFCFLFADRRDPEAVGAVVRGDRELARELLSTTPCLVRLRR
ncbi:hypothetical protein Plo01_70840 [Planobispora longispora]|uniref:Mycothiol-dependent maleylpyruvate isomerase metal-binding domain-containing protein n=1 Tax=Planobispora longispora TaxID=28887 RepID=A0A8J3RSS2_9ACTN|nr:hypothetical protein Plo01_70840 [Planobispora longispora]